MTDRPDPAALAARFATVLEVPVHRALEVRFADPDDPTQGLLLPVRGLALNPQRVLHGGLVPTLLDVAAYLTVVPHLRPGTNAVTHTAQASLARAVPEGATVRFVGHLDRIGRTLAFCGARAYDGDRLVATGTLVKSIVPLPDGSARDA
ncbi:PaaI family thioesterase [Conexibacter sp. W3-3-2]|uniref:PaaI family thioesterase n=1 Tax=Paraconexibacter algicola TaxID=2133960 RepID=A0A2T4ULZ1_9ACTN|nr:MULTISPECIES: PaaI family thioesterase [Solirubrobacterales]MTD46610.1 PaaI family thioesterase [Conexibacter sp. W3-3-2]PTL60245.1 PaaI family thioesterase [Paraconexibacter algicola]